MGKKDDLESTLVGVAGEYFVAAELSRRGYLASITLRNSRGVDIIASNSEASRSVTIQVKTSNKSGAKWILNKKAESFADQNHYYVFVLLGSPSSRPDFYIVPSVNVAEYVSNSHRRWLAGTKADGTPRKDSQMRNFRDPDGMYKEKWEVLELLTP
jgi:hypothetical protein